MRTLLILAAAAAALTLSVPADPGDRDSDRDVARSEALALVKALHARERPAADRERDRARRPAEVLGFFQVRPGMTVLDMFSAGGYYSEILSRYIGNEGQVYAHNHEAYRKYAAKEIEARYRHGEPGNVKRLDAEVAALDLPADSLDVVLLVLSYHDVYFAPGDGSWTRIDGAAMLADLYAALKSGGVLGVVDHVGAAGLDEEGMNALHRIDPARARREIEAAGFAFDGKLDILRNPADDHSKAVFDPQVRGKTDRFVYRFRKPG